MLVGVSTCPSTTISSSVSFVRNRDGFGLEQILSSLIELKNRKNEERGNDILTFCLVGVRETTHTGHDTENIVVRGKDRNLANGTRPARRWWVRGKRSRVREVEDKLGIVDTREIARARRLVLLRAKTERIQVDVLFWDARVMLVRLHKAEVRLRADLETIVAVEEDLGVSHEIDGVRRNRRAGEGGREIEPIVVSGTDRKVALTLENPDKLLDGVVEVKTNLVGNLVKLERLSASELELIDEVLMRHLREAAALLGIEVDIVDPESTRVETDLAVVELGDIREEIAIASGSKTHDHLRCGTELHRDLDLVVLEGNERKGKARVAVEPEHERDVVDARVVGVTDKTDVSGVLTNHVVVTVALLRSLGKLVPDLEPHAPLLVDLLTTNFDVDTAHERVTERVGPSNVVGEGAGTSKVVDRAERKSRELHLKIDVIDKITVTGDGASHLAAEISSA